MGSVQLWSDVADMADLRYQKLLTMSLTFNSLIKYVSGLCIIILLNTIAGHLMEHESGS